MALERPPVEGRRFRLAVPTRVLSKVLNPLLPVEAIELLIDKLVKTKSNAESLSAMQKMG